MKDQIVKYTNKLIQDKTAIADSIRFYALDDEVIASREDEWKPVFESVLAELNVVGLLLARPVLPFADYLIAKAAAQERRIYPRDSEIKTFLHDIPFIRKAEIADDLPGKIAAVLRERKGLVIEGVGFVSCGTVTLEQAYIVYSSIFHATFIKYLYDLLETGFTVPGEREAFYGFWEGWPVAPDTSTLRFRQGPLMERLEILDEIAVVGRYTVETGLVDSFFGNISCFSDGIVYISQTGASLDELDGFIDPVPMDNSSTYGITASSELPVHRRIYETTGYRTVLHGHPKFSVIISMLCDKRASCDIADCGKNCPETRMFGGIPIVAGEIGAGGVAKNAPPVVREFGRALVYGHGSFCVGSDDFKEAFAELARMEETCRLGYLKLLQQRLDTV
ncbi:MAG: class II aldolase/adducin family protein [Candidatus Aquicultor sp.]